VTTPAGWRRISLNGAASLAVPPDAQDQGVQPIDSIFGILRGQGYEVIYDYGRSGEQLTMYKDEPGFISRNISVDGRPGTEVSFQGSGQPWGHVRMLQVQHGRDVLTIRVSCSDEDTCRLADDLFHSVRFGSS